MQAFLETALERAVAPHCSLNSLHQRVKLLPILFSDGVFDRYCDRPVIVVRAGGKIPFWIERRGINACLGGEIDRNPMPDGQHSEGQNRRGRKGQIEAGLCYSRPPYQCTNRDSPCPSMIWNAFIRPRTHPGITRCPATQSSDPASDQATPARNAQSIKVGS